MRNLKSKNKVDGKKYSIIFIIGLIIILTSLLYATTNFENVSFLSPKASSGKSTIEISAYGKYKNNFSPELSLNLNGEDIPIIKRITNNNNKFYAQTIIIPKKIDLNKDKVQLRYRNCDYDTNDISLKQIILESIKVDGYILYSRYSNSIDKINYNIANRVNGQLYEDNLDYGTDSDNLGIISDNEIDKFKVISKCGAFNIGTNSNNTQNSIIKVYAEGSTSNTIKPRLTLIHNNLIYDVVNVPSRLENSKLMNFELIGKKLGKGDKFYLIFDNDTCNTVIDCDNKRPGNQNRNIIISQVNIDGVDYFINRFPKEISYDMADREDGSLYKGLQTCRNFNDGICKTDNTNQRIKFYGTMDRNGALVIAL